MQLRELGGEQKKALAIHLFSFFLDFVMMALRGAGDSMTPLLFMGLSAIVDVVLNPVLTLTLARPR